MSMHKHVTIVAILHIVLSSIVLFAAIVVFGVLTGIGFVAGDPEAFLILGGVGTILSIILLVLALPGIIGGVGLLAYRPWARILMLVLSVLNLLNIPIGTAIGIYTIWVLMNDETEKLFRNGSLQIAPAPQPQIPPPAA